MKNILIDLSHLGTYCGFGYVEKEFSKQLALQRDDQLHFILMVPERFVGFLGPDFDYIRKEYARKDLKALGKPVDLWHATTQMFRFRQHAKGRLQLLTIHDLNYLYEKQFYSIWKHQLQQKHYVRHSDYVTTISKFVEDEVSRHVGFRGKAHRVVYNGVGWLPGSPMRKPDFVTDGNKILFTIGQIREKKNFMKLVEMMPYMEGYSLYICGDKHFKFARQLEQRIAELNTGRIFLPGTISDEEKVWLYQHCDAFLFPSRLEGFGLPLIEAMQFGKHVFSSRLTCLPEIGKDYAFYWDHFEPQYMADEVKKGLLKPVDRAEIEYARSYSFEQYTKEYIALYKELLGVRG